MRKLRQRVQNMLYLTFAGFMRCPVQGITNGSDEKRLSIPLSSGRMNWTIWSTTYTLMNRPWVTA